MYPRRHADSWYSACAKRVICCGDIYVEALNLRVVGIASSLRGLRSISARDRRGKRELFTFSAATVPSSIVALNGKQACIGSEGLEPSPHRLKGEYAAITPRPWIVAWRAFP